MKWCLFFFPLTVAIANDGCLTQATNQELVNEIGRRMNLPTPAQEAIASYECDLYGVLTISLLSNQAIQSQTVKINQSSACQKAAVELTTFRSRILKPSFAAVCDIYGTLFKFGMTPSGGLSLVSNNDMGTQSQCTKTATAINSSGE